MDRHQPTPLHSESPVAAGDFGDWLNETLAGLRSTGRADVPCGSCRGCCTSSYFVHLTPADSSVRAAIPAQLVVAWPGAPAGFGVLVHRADGSCAMLDAGECSIYPARPAACRAYDCRVFTAAGLGAGGRDKARINARVRAWRFSYDNDQARARHAAIQRAARFIASEGSAFSGGRVPTAPDEVAVLAIKVHEVFMRPGIDRMPVVAVAQAVVDAARAFEASTHP